MGTLGLTADGVFNPGVTQGLGEQPRVDQYDFVCTTQVLWVNDGAIDPTRSLSSPLGPVTALGFSGNDALRSWPSATIRQSRSQPSRGSTAFSAATGLRALAQPDKDTCIWCSKERVLEDVF